MTTGYYELDKLTFLQRQKYDHLFQVLYDTTNDKTVSRQDFLELLKKVQILRKWPTGCAGYSQAERIIAKVWTAFQKGNRKYRNKDSQMHIRDHEWRRYWGDFVEAARAARGWPECSLDGDVNYEWQKDYMHFMFNLMDTNGDGGLDRAEYLKCFSSFGLTPEDCNTAFDKFAVDSYGRPLDEVDINRFEELWFQYLTSDDLNSHPGNYLMGKLDLQQHAPAHYPMDQQIFVQGSPNEQVRKGPQQPKVVGVKPSSVTMVYGQITGGGPRISADDDQIYDPSRVRYHDDIGSDIAGKRGQRGGPQQRQPQGGSGGNQPKYGGGPGGQLGQMGVAYGQNPAPAPARQDSQGKTSLQIKMNSVVNPNMGPPQPAQGTSIQNTPVNYASHGQINLSQQQQQQQQPQRQISATSNSSATAPSIAAFNCTVEDAPSNSGYSRPRPGQQGFPNSPAARSTATFNNPRGQQQQPTQTNQLGGGQSNQFGQSYGPEKSFQGGQRSHGQVRMPVKQNPGRRGAPFMAEPAKPTPPPPGGPRGGRPVYSDF